MAFAGAVMGCDGDLAPSDHLDPAFVTLVLAVMGSDGDLAPTDHLPPTLMVLVRAVMRLG